MSVGLHVAIRRHYCGLKLFKARLLIASWAKLSLTLHVVSLSGARLVYLGLVHPNFGGQEHGRFEA